MTSEEEERPTFVTGVYRRHRHQWVNNASISKISKIPYILFNLILNGQWLNIYSAYQKCIKIFKLQTINESERLKTETVLTALQRSLVLQANVVSSHDQCVFILLLHHYAVLCLELTLLATAQCIHKYVCIQVFPWYNLCFSLFWCFVIYV